MKLSHIIYPFKYDENNSSKLDYIQPITFRSIYLAIKRQI